MGFKKTSEIIAVSFGLTELAPNTFIQEEIALQLDVLNNEIAVIVGVDMDVTNPDAVAATDTSVKASVTATTLGGIGNLSQSNTIATASEAIRAAGFVDGGVSFTRAAETTPFGDTPYIALISTNNFFVQLLGVGNLAPSGVTGRVWLYRARADANTYAALVQSEVLSA